VPGVVIEVRKNLGDTVQPGEVMAVLDSRELADAKTAYLAARERVALARATHLREEQLWQKRISAEQEYLAAKNAFAEAVIEMDSAEQKLHSIGFSDDDLAAMAAGSEKDLTRYAIAAPFAATIIDKHITLGEVIRDDTSVFLIADLRTVWIELSVHQHDLPLIRRGQRVAISGGPGQQAEGEVSFIGTQLADQTRTLPLRVVLPNPDGRWRPGLFVTGAVTVNDIEVPVAAPAEAVVLVDGQSTVFVRTASGFEARTVTTGRGDGRRVEITAGVRPGEAMVVRGAFTLKSELDKPEAHEH
jgi:cobalt-zinc-cadmium efflux system membrane fusion protein